DFMRLTTRPQLPAEVIDPVAEANHIAWLVGMLEEGHRWGEDDESYLLAHDVLRPFVGKGAMTHGKDHANMLSWSRLEPGVQEDNRGFARNLPGELQLNGYAVRTARDKTVPAAAPTWDVELIEILAEREHDRWMLSKLRDGWKHGPKRRDPH